MKSEESFSGEVTPEVIEIDKADYKVVDESRIDESKETVTTRKKWEEMLEEERREVYGRSFELREKLYSMNKARAEMIFLENSKDRFFSSVEEYEWEEARDRYEWMRAEYVGAKSWRLLKERQKMAEEDAKQYQEGTFEKIRQGWRWLGDQNLEKLGWKPTSKTGRFFSKALSARTGLSLALLGGGLALGAGSAVGIGAIAARRIISGTSTGLGVYDLMNLMGEKRKLAKLEGEMEHVEDMSPAALETRMAELEALARFNGDRIVHGEEYQKLRRAYHKIIESSDNASEETLETLLGYGDERIVEKQKLKRANMIKKGVAVTAGALVGSGTLMQLISRGVVPIGTTIENIKKIIDSGPAIVKKVFSDLVQDEMALPEKILDRSKVVNILEESAPLSEEVFALEAEKIIPETEKVIETTIKSEQIGTVKKGGSAWQALQDLVKNGTLTQEEFSKAWSSSASVITLASGQTIHISELGSVHPGDQFAYVPATEDSPAKFALIKNTIKIGSNVDLAEAFDISKTPRPAWLEEALGATEEDKAIPHGENTVAAEATEPASLQTESPIKDVDKASSTESVSKEVSIETLEMGKPISLPWGHLNFIHDSEGKIVSYAIKEQFLTPGARVKAVEQATALVLSSDYQDRLEEVVKIGVSQITVEEEGFKKITKDMLSGFVAQSKETAFKIKTLRDIFDASEPESREWLYLRDELRRITEEKTLRPGVDPYYPLKFLRWPPKLIKDGIIP